MKMLLPVLTAALIAAPALAQTAPADSSAMPAPAAPSATPPAAAPAANARFSLATPIKTIVADEAAAAALRTAIEADITQAPFYEQIKDLSFTQLQPLSQGALTDETMAKIAAALATVQ